VARERDSSLLHSVQTGSAASGYRKLFPQGQSGLGVKLTTDFHIVPRSRMVKLQFQSPICLYGTVLDLLSKGTILLLTLWDMYVNVFLYVYLN
jgi:hypothetical protein